MPILTEGVVASRLNQPTSIVRKSVESRIISAATDTFDVFLSHSSSESDNMLTGVVGLLEDIGLTVYVDRFFEPDLSKDGVTAKTATVLRQRMQRSRCLLYLHSRNSTSSRWMPWELGYFDGRRGRVAIIPVVADSQKTYSGSEYLGLYPYLDYTSLTSFWINPQLNQDYSVERFLDWVKRQ